MKMTRTTNYFRATVLILIHPWAPEEEGGSRERELFVTSEQLPSFHPSPRTPGPNTGAVVVAVSQRPGQSFVIGSLERV